MIVHRPVHDTLLGERRIVTRIPESLHATARPAALRAVRIDVGARAFIERSRGVARRGERIEPGNRAFGGRVVEQADMRPRAELIVRHAVRIEQVAVELARLRPKHAAGIGIMAGDTVRAAGIIPRLDAGALQVDLRRRLRGGGVRGRRQPEINRARQSHGQPRELAPPHAVHARIGDERIARPLHPQPGVRIVDQRL